MTQITSRLRLIIAVAAGLLLAAPMAHAWEDNQGGGSQPSGGYSAPAPAQPGGAPAQVSPGGADQDEQARPAGEPAGQDSGYQQNQGDQGEPMNPPPESDDDD